MALAERLQIFIETVGSGKAAADFRQVGGAAQGLAGQVKTGKLGLDGLASSAGISAGALKVGLVAGAAVAGAALVRFGSDSVSAFTDLARSVRDVQRITGGTAEEASKLVAILDDFEVPVETLNKGFFRLSREIGKSDTAFQNAGFAVARNAKGNVDLSATLLNIADAYTATQDPAQRATLLTSAFGRGGAELIPILEKGRAGIEAVFDEAGRFGQILSQEDIDKAEELRLALDDLHDATGEMQLAVGEALVPTMTKLAVATTSVVDALNSVKSVGTDVWEGLANKLGPVGDALAWIGVGNPMPWLGAVGGDASGAADDLDDLGDAIGGAGTEIADLEKVMLASTSASRAYAQATRGVETANRGLASAQKELTDLLKEGAVDEEKVADARRSLADATRSVADANRGVAKAQRDYDEAVAGAAALGGLDSAMEDVADKAEGLADAQDTAAGAADRATDAAEQLREAQAGDPEFQDKLAKARLGVKDATQGVADANYDLAQRTRAAIEAQDLQTAALAGSEAAAKGLYDQLTLLRDTYPDLAGMLSPQIARLSPEWHGPPVPAAGAASTSTTTTNSIVINAPQQADPVHIARRMMWELN